MTQSKKTVLITGAYGGLGKALAKTYHDHGFSLCLLGKNKNKLKALSKLSTNLYSCDFSDNLDIVETCEEIKKNHEKIDIIINCAAVFPISSLTEMSIKDFQRCMQINVTAPFLLTKQLLHKMKKGSKIINIASSSAYGGSPNTSAYCASKHALLGLSRSWFKELKSEDIRVFCVSPGSIQTKMGKEVEKLGQLYNTFMTPQEVAEYVFFATSFEGSMVSEEIRLNRMVVQ